MFSYADELNKLCSRLVDKARLELVATGELHPMLFFVCKCQGDFLLMPVLGIEQFRNNKGLIPHFISVFWKNFSDGFDVQRDIELLAVCFFTDTWVAEAMTDGIAISERPDRKPAILFNLYFADRADGYFIRYSKQPGNIEVASPVKMEIQPGFWMSDLYPRY